MVRDSLISFPIRGIFNGVSQQPSHIRREGFAEAQENGYSSMIDGLKKRPPTEAVKKLKDYAAPGTSTTIDGVHFVDRGSAEQHVILIEDGEIEVYDLNGTAKTVDKPDGQAYLATSSSTTEYKFLTLADVTYIVNPDKTPAMASDLSAENADLVGSTSGGHTLIFLKGSAGSGNYTWTVAGTSGTRADSGDLGADATAIASTINGYSDITATAKGQVIYLYRTDSTLDVDVAVDHSKGDEYITTIKDSIEAFSSLPVFAPHNYILKVSGAPESTFDDYYVKFQGKSTTVAGTMDEGTWIETVAPNIKFKFDPTTMPHVLINDGDGTYTFAQADGTDVASFKWGEREAGDTTTNKDPGFIGEKIKDIFFHKNRLGFVTSDTIVMSESGEFFNFFTVSVTDSLATDCMNLNINHSNAVNFHSAVSFQDDLIVFGDNDQFKVTGTPVLSNNTVQATLLSSYQSINTARPVVTSNKVFFCFERENFTGVYQLTPSTTVQGQYADSEISLHIPRYIPSALKQMESLATENLMVALSSGETSSLFVYKYFMSQNKDIQTSWSKFTFDNSNIRGMGFVNNSLYMINRRSDAWYLEKISFQAKQVDANATYLTHVDRRIKDTDTTVTYDSATDRTKYVLPYKIGSGVTMQVVTRSTGSVTGGKTLKVVSQVADQTELFIQGQYNTTSVWIGEQYTMTYQMSKPKFRDRRDQLVNEGRLLLRRGSLDYSESGYFRVEVTPAQRTTYSYPFTGRVLGSSGLTVGSNPISSGTFDYGVRTSADDVVIKIVNDSPLPSTISSVTFEGTYSSRASRL